MADLVRVGSVGKGGVGGVAKQVKVERPRPLKIGGGTHPELSLEDLLVVIEGVRKNLGIKCEDGGEQMVGQLQLLSANLKIRGPTLELSHKDQMDKLIQSLMAACNKSDSLDLVARIHMLEIIELRSMGWQPNENVTNYYKQKLVQIECKNNSNAGRSQTAPVSLNSNSSSPNPFSKSFETKMTSRNSKLSPELKIDSHKVTNLRSRSNMSNCGDIHDDNQSSAIKDESEFECSVRVGTEELKVSGMSMELVKTAKIVLHEFFNICPPEDAIMESPPPETAEKTQGARSKNISGGVVLIKPEISYEKQELMELAKSPLCKIVPNCWNEVTKDLPGVVRRADRAGPTSKIIQREMEGLRKQEEAKNV